MNAVLSDALVISKFSSNLTVVSKMNLSGGRRFSPFVHLVSPSVIAIKSERQTSLIFP